MQVAPMDSKAEPEPEPEKANATPIDWDAVEWDQRPAGSSGPTEVELVIGIKRWEVSSASGHEVLFIYGKLEMYWRDERMVGFPLKKSIPEDIWRPQLIACVGFNLGPAEKYELMPKFNGNNPDVSDGRMQMVADFDFGSEGWNISDDLERMRLFPFDSTRIDVSLMFTGRRRKEMLDLEVKPCFTRQNAENRVEEGHPLQHVDWMTTRHSDDYEMIAFSYALGNHPPPSFFRLPHHDENTRVADLLLSFHIQRTPSFYVSKGIRPLFMVALFGFIVFGLESHDLGTRISVLAALFLTAFAVQWVTIERLPRLPFSTILDHVAQSVVNALVLMCIVALISYRLGRPPNSCGANNNNNDDDDDDDDDGDDDDCSFDKELGALIDFAGAALVMGFLLLETIGFRIFYSVWRSTKVTGWSRPWCKGKFLRNKRFVPHEAYRLITDEAFVARNGSKFLGAGTSIAEPATAF